MDVVVALRSFLRVAETGSFSTAALDLRLTQSAVSRQIAALEDHFAVRLFHRTTAGLSLTAEGERTLPLAHRMLETVDELADTLRPGDARVRGQVRLSVPTPLGLYLGDRLGGLLATHPDLAIDLILRDRPSDLIAEGIDLEVRLGPAADSSLVSRRIGSTTAFLVATPGWLAAHGPPTVPEDLCALDCLFYRRSGADQQWSFADGSGHRAIAITPRLISDNAMAIHRATLAGMGVAVLSHILVADDIAAGRLVALMPDHPPARLPMFAVYPTRRNIPERVRAVLDFLMEAIAADEAMRAD